MSRSSADLADGHGDAQALFSILGIVQAASIAFIVAGLAINRLAGGDEDPARLELVPALAPSGGPVSARSAASERRGGRCPLR